MSKLFLKWFGGMVPRRGYQHLNDDEKIQETGIFHSAPQRADFEVNTGVHASEAENCSLFSGELRPIKQPALAHQFCRPGQDCWRSPIPDDPSVPPEPPPEPPSCVPVYIESQGFLGCYYYACDAVEAAWDALAANGEWLVFYTPQDNEEGSYNLINYGSIGGTVFHGGGLTDATDVIDRCFAEGSWGGLAGGAAGQRVSAWRDAADKTGEGDTMTIGTVVRSGAALGVGSGNIMGYRTPDPGGTTDIGWNPSSGTVTASAMNYNAGYEVNITVTAPELYGYDGDDNPVWKHITVNVERAFGAGAYFQITVYVAGVEVGVASATETTNGTPLATWPVWTPDFNPPNEDITRGPHWGADARASWYDLPQEVMFTYMSGYGVLSPTDIAGLEDAYQRNFESYEVPGCPIIPGPECLPYACDAYEVWLTGTNAEFQWNFTDGGPTPQPGINDYIEATKGPDLRVVFVSLPYNDNPEYLSPFDNCSGFMYQQGGNSSHQWHAGYWDESTQTIGTGDSWYYEPQTTLTDPPALYIHHGSDTPDRIRINEVSDTVDYGSMFDNVAIGDRISIPGADWTITGIFGGNPGVREYSIVNTLDGGVPEVSYAGWRTMSIKSGGDPDLKVPAPNSYGWDITIGGIVAYPYDLTFEVEGQSDRYAGAHRKGFWIPADGSVWIDSFFLIPAEVVGLTGNVDLVFVTYEPDRTQTVFDGAAKNAHYKLWVNGEMKWDSRTDWVSGVSTYRSDYFQKFFFTSGTSGISDGARAFCGVWSRALSAAEHREAYIAFQRNFVEYTPPPECP